MLAALTALFKAATAYLKVWPLLKIHSIENEIQGIDYEILTLGDTGTPAAKLRIELLAKNRQRKAESIRSLRSTIGDPDQGP